ncbi:MAG: NUDIX hydrolase [Actinomycetota bacterium]|nr:NUDIX hydrolase [Actinomycetota bacterium]
MTWWRRAPQPAGPPTIQAAGGAVWRRSPLGLEVVLVHRPRYDDWTLPKGKLAGGENHLAAALREVEEETGLRCDPGPELPGTAYRDRHDRPKMVRYWAMTPVEGEFVPSREVDRIRWLPTAEADALLTYDRERPVLDALTSTV